jgi:hypothetical protein
VYVGSQAGGKDFFSGGLNSNHQFTVSGLPTTGTIYVRYSTRPTPTSAWEHELVSYTMDVGNNSGGGFGSEGNHTLRWDQKLTMANRFVLVLNGNSVLDKETGLVWFQTPQGGAVWAFGPAGCINRQMDGRKGWRLPSVHELASLVDTNVQSPANALNMPNGPFHNVQGDWYWSATTSSGNPDSAWAVNFGNGEVDTNAKTDFNLVWCVRGGGPLSEY